MSHELRTPPNATLGFAQLLQLDDEHSQSVSRVKLDQALPPVPDHWLDTLTPSTERHVARQVQRRLCALRATCAIYTPSRSRGLPVAKFP